MDPIADWHALLRPDEELTPQFAQAFAAAMRAQKLTFGQRVHCPFLRPFFLSARRRSPHQGRRRDARRARRARRPRRDVIRRSLRAARHDRSGGSAHGHRAGLRHRQHRIAPRRLPAAGLAALRRVQRRVAGRHRLHAAAGRALRRLAGDGPVQGEPPGAVSSRHREPAERAARELPRVGRHGLAADDRDRRLARRPDLDRVRAAARCLRRRRRADRHLRSARAGADERGADGAGREDRSGLPPRPRQRHHRPAGPNARRSSTPAPPASSAWPTASSASWRTRRRSSPS